VKGPFAVFKTRRMAVLFLLGFSSGLPYLLTGETLRLWLVDAKADLAHIAQFVSVTLPYNIKFLWAPLLDRYRVPFLGRRRGWICVFQLLLTGALLAMSRLDPSESLGAFAVVAVVIAVLSASQDIVIDAYTNDVLSPEERAAGSASAVMGYRLAMLVASSLALVLADHIPWHVVYALMAALMLGSVAVTVIAPEPPPRPNAPRTLADAFTMPVIDFFRRLGWRHALVIVAFAATYKFGEQFAQTLTAPFFRQVIGFTKTEIGVLQKAVGFSAWAIGGAAGGVLVARYGVRRMLIAFGLLQATTHIAYLWIAAAGKNLAVYGVAIFLENVSFAMATSAFVAMLLSMSATAMSATQYALLTSLTTVAAKACGWFAPDVVATVGWTGFFLTSIAMAIPGIILAHFAGRVAEAHASRAKDEAGATATPRT
jgi:MFS transporter, PAT family, beta-lactamase induction signal transducer AmpG